MTMVLSFPHTPLPLVLGVDGTGSATRSPSSCTLPQNDHDDDRPVWLVGVEENTRVALPCRICRILSCGTMVVVVVLVVDAGAVRALNVMGVLEAIPREPVGVDGGSILNQKVGGNE